MISHLVSHWNHFPSWLSCTTFVPFSMFPKTRGSHLFQSWQYSGNLVDSFRFWYCLLNDFQVFANCQKSLLWPIGATGLPLLTQVYPPDPAGLEQREPIFAEELYICGPHALNAAPGSTRPVLTILLHPVHIWLPYFFRPLFQGNKHLMRTSLIFLNKIILTPTHVTLLLSFFLFYFYS